MPFGFGLKLGFDRGAAGLSSMTEPFSVVVDSGYAYVRTAWGGGKDLVQRVNYVGSPSVTSNAPLTPNGVKLISSVTANSGLVTAYNAAATTDILAGQTDDPPPIKYNNTYVGANHGVNFAKKITVTGHDKTFADVGSLWTNGSVNFYIIKIFDANTLWVMSANSGSADLWTFNTTLVSNGTLTHVSGATHTGNITFTTSVTQQIYPSVNRVSKKIYADNVEITSDGIYTCTEFKAVESYDIVNPASMLSYLIANVGSATELALNDESIDSQVGVGVSYTYTDSGACVVDYDLHTYQRISLSANYGYVGGIQAQPISWHSAGGETINFYIPRISPITGSVKTWDFQSIEDISGTFEQLDFTSAKWTDANNPPERMVQLVKTSGGVKRFGFVLGYQKAALPGSNLKNYIGRNGYISSVRKMYPYALTQASTYLSGGSTVSAGVDFAVNAYRIFFNSANNADATTCAWYVVGDTTYVILDFHSTLASTNVLIDDRFAGRTVSVVESSASVTVNSSTYDATNGVNVSVSGGYGYAILSLG